MSKFYAAKGDENAVFTDWESCKNFLEGKKGYKYKSFYTEEEARAFLEDRDIYAERTKEDISKGYAVAYTDGSFEESVGDYSYGVIAISEGKEEYFSGYGNNPEFLPTRNVAGEVMGVLAACEWAVANGYPRLKIYHDYAGLSMWVNGQWRAESPIAVYYAQKFKEFSYLLYVEFCKVKGHANNRYNELVDGLAKKALFERQVLTLGYQKGIVVGELDVFLPLCNFINKQSVKSFHVEKNGGIEFLYLGEKVGVYNRQNKVLLSGKITDKLFSIALSFIVEQLPKNEVNRLIDEVFGVDFDEETKDKSLSLKLIDKFNLENYSPFLWYSLQNCSSKIKQILSLNDIVFDRISSLFIKEENSFKLKDDNFPDSKKVEELYNWFYNFRIGFFTIQLDKNQAKKAVCQYLDIAYGK